MRIQLNEEGYVTGYCSRGENPQMTEYNGALPERFTERYRACRRNENGALVYDEARAALLVAQDVAAAIRARRAAECFPMINRGQLWYERLNADQCAQLNSWYTAWLDAPQTGVIPAKPEWLT